MLRTRILFLSFCCAIASAASATTLDFNNLQVGEEVLNYYNGGLGSLGTGPGPNYGVTFTPDFVTVAQGVFGPPLRAESLTVGNGVMNALDGFSGPFSFYYEAAAAGSVAFYSGLNGTGTLLGNLVLPAATIFTPAGGVEPLFRSVVFNVSSNSLVVDNITFGAFVVPEPSSAGLLWVGLVALALAPILLRRCALIEKRQR